MFEITVLHSCADDGSHSCRLKSPEITRRFPRHSCIQILWRDVSCWRERRGILTVCALKL